MEPLAYTIAEVCVVARAGRTGVYGAIRAGDLRACKCGRRTLVLATDLKDWVEQLPAIETKPRAPCDHREREQAGNAAAG
jgi:excisionase family DNA binding protein